MIDKLPDPNSPTIIPMSSLVSNYTSSDIGGLNGEITTNSPHIWLQYNNTVWVMVPPKYLTNPQKSSLATTTQDGDTWAIGIYENPNDIANGAPVLGAVSIGRFANWNPSMDGAYVFFDILTIRDSSNYYQIGMVNVEGEGNRINVEKWTTGGLKVFSLNFNYPVEVGTAYNEYIKYYDNQWQYWWNFIYVYSTGAASSQLVMGNQATAAVESNDFTWDDFSEFRADIGGIYTHENGTQYYMPAAAFLFNEQWVPRKVGDDVPATYAYIGGTT